MRGQKRLKWLLLGWLVLFIAGGTNISCMAKYYYDPQGHRIWRDGHDDDWHRAHGDHWDEYHPDH